MYSNDPDAIQTRPGSSEDADQINEIYNWYVTNSSITFDIAPWTLDRRKKWIADLIAPGSPYHLLIATHKNRIVGFTYNTQFRAKAAYDAATEVTIYTRQPDTPKGTGSVLYRELFAALKLTSLHRAYAVISLPNPDSVRLHQKFGFQLVGTLNEVGTKFDHWIDVAWYEKKLDE